MRNWTDLQQRKVEAAFDHLAGNNVVLKLRDTRILTVPLASLSAPDRQWISQQTSAAPAADARPPASADWPRTVGLQSAPVVQTIKEDAKGKEFIYESEHYRFICDSMLGANAVREFSKVFEATWLVNCLLPLDFQPAPEGDRKKFQARIFTQASEYHQAGGPAGSGGVYISSLQTLMLPLDSLGVKMFGSRVTVDYKAQDYATLVHETTHQMMNHWIERLPLWYVEGSAVYIQLAKYENGHFSFLQQDKRLREYLSWGNPEGKFQMVPIARLMTLDNRTWQAGLTNGEATANYASAVALTYYFYNLDGDGKGTHFEEYIRAVAKLKPGEDPNGPVKEYLLRGRDYATLQKDVEKGMRRAGIPVEFPDGN